MPVWKYQKNVNLSIKQAYLLKKDFNIVTLWYFNNLGIL